MKTLAILLLIFPFTLFGQITLSVSDFANTGDTVRMSETTDMAIDYSTTGANQNWDFSSLTPESQFLEDYLDLSGASFLVQFQYGTFAPSNYQASYYRPTDAIPLAQMSGLLPVTIDDVFLYTKRSSDSITSVGYSVSIEGNEVPFKSDTIETLYKFPLNFGNSYSSRGYSKLDMNPIYNGQWIQYRQRNSTVDGWGSITTPYGNFNALRIHHVITETDSIYIDFSGSGFWLPIPVPDRNIYEWWTNSEKSPILRITTTEIFGNETVSGIEYRDIYRGLDAGMEELQVNFSLYPNPASEVINVHTDLLNVNYQIIGMDGRTYQEGKFESFENEISVKSLSEGTYTLSLTNNGRSTSRLFIKK